MITAGIAHHYLAAGAQREALVASVRAADAAERVHAHGEAGALLERALDLWPRVPDAAAQAGCDRDELLRRAGRALINDGAYIRAEALLRAAVGEVDESRDPRRRRRPARAAVARPVVARARGGRRATRSPARSALLPEDDHSPERARILARQAKIAMLQGRFSEVLPAAEAAIGAARHADADGPLADALNAMGYSLILLGEVEDGQRPAARGDRDLARAASSAPARGPTSPTRCTSSAARTRRCAAAEQGLGRHRGRRGASATGCRSTLLEIRWDLGDWEAARAALPPRDKRHIGMTLAYVETLRAEIALADGEHDEARASLDRVADVVQGSREPQFLGWFGSLRGELERRCGDLAAARAAVDDGLDAIEFCSEDLPRIALLSETGARDRGRRRPARARPRRRGGRARGDLPRRGRS